MRQWGCWCDCPCQMWWFQYVLNRKPSHAFPLLQNLQASCRAMALKAKKAQGKQLVNRTRLKHVSRIWPNTGTVFNTKWDWIEWVTTFVISSPMCLCPFLKQKACPQDTQTKRNTYLFYCFHHFCFHRRQNSLLSYLSQFTEA